MGSGNSAHYISIFTIFLEYNRLMGQYKSWVIKYGLTEPGNGKDILEKTFTS
jgi:hypothetical protein